MAAHDASGLGGVMRAKTTRERMGPGFRVLERPAEAAITEQLRAHNFGWSPALQRFVRKGGRY